MTLGDSIQGFRLRVLREAQRCGNVSGRWCMNKCEVSSRQFRLDG